MLDTDVFTNSTIVIFDTEYTAWPGSHENGWSREGEYREIVQMGAVKVDTGKGFTETDSFQCLVKPKLNPTLSQYFIDLTGISQQDVDERGVPFAEMLRAFEAFCEGATVVASNGRDDRVIAENCAWHDLTMADANYVNLSQTFCSALGAGRHVTSGTLCERFGLPHEGRLHDALTDARCIAAALRELMTTRDPRGPIPRDRSSGG